MEVIGAVGKIREIAAAYTVVPEDRVLLISAYSDYTITLPTVESVAGKWFCFFVYERDTDCEVTIDCQGSDDILIGGSVGSLEFNAANEYLIIFSDGRHFYRISKESL